MTSSAIDPSPPLDRALEFIGARHGALIDDVAASRRVLWLGSGISLREVLGLKGLIRKILLFLQTKSAGSVHDAHGAALKHIIETYFPAWAPGYATDPSNWQVPEIEHFPPFIENHYSEILAEPVGNEPPDYLLWEAVDVRETYGAPTINPGINHKLVAALMLEGLLPRVVSANWDGLIELAYRKMGGGVRHDDVRVLMTSQDFRTASGTSGPKLYKIHGCAVRARSNPMFRNHLVARQIQITQWGIGSDPYCRMKTDVTNLVSDSPTLVVGLSFQGYNLIQTHVTSSEEFGWNWNADAPAYVVADNALKQGHRELFEGAYGEAYTRDRAGVGEASLIPMYAEPLLAALVLRITTLKIMTLLLRVGVLSKTTAVYLALVLALKRRELEISAAIATDYDRLVTFLVGSMSPLVHRFHGMDIRLGYVSIQQGTLQALRTGGEAARTGAPDLAALLALVNYVAYEEGLHMTLGDAGDESGVIEVSRAGEESHYLVPVKNDQAAAEVRRSALWSDSKKRIVLVRPDGARQSSPRRSSAMTLGQGRRPGALRHEVYVERVWGQHDQPSEVSKEFLRVISL